MKEQKETRRALGGRLGGVTTSEAGSFYDEGHGVAVGGMKKLEKKKQVDGCGKK